jgi:hypothetical protein
MAKVTGPFLMQFSKDETIEINPKILRIFVSDQYTRIDFGYMPDDIYDYGWWITIDRNTYVQVRDSSKKYVFIEAIGIPVTPDKWEFDSIMDWKVFTLLFEPIPIKDCTIDVIENLEPGGNFFNYYNISLSMENRMVCLDNL